MKAMIVMDCQGMTNESYGTPSGPEVLVKVGKGATGEYVGHVPGGNVAVKIGDVTLIFHPSSVSFEE